MSHTETARVMTPRSRFFVCYCLALTLLGPFGFIVGPLVAHDWTKRVERKNPFAAGQAKARDHGYNWGQLVLMTVCTLWGLSGALFVYSLVQMVAVPLLYGT